MANVLIVDDEAGLREAMKIVLDRSGYNTVATDDGIKAQELMSTQDFDVVVTDICMPRMSGVELLKAIKKNSPHIKVIMITGNPDIGGAAEAVRTRAFDYLVKPISIKDFVRVVQKAIQMKFLEDENRIYKENLEVLVQEQTKELKEGERRYRLLAENVSDIIWTMDLNYHITYISPSIKRILGYDPDELSDSFLKTVLSQESYMQIMRLIKNDFSIKTINTNDTDFNSTKIMEVEHFKKDKTAIWAEIRINYILENHYTPVGIIGVTRDVSYRKRIEMELTESESNFRNLAENAVDGIIIALRNSSHLYANSRAQKITGYSYSELLNRAIEDLLTPEERVNAVKLNRLKNYEESIKQYETVLLRKDQTRVPVEISSTETIWHDSHADLIFIRDISEKKKTENLLKDENQKTKQLLDIANVIILSINLNREISLINKKGQEIFGYSASEMTGKNWFEEFIAPTDHDFALDVFNKFIAGELEPYYYHENKIITKSKDNRIIGWYNVGIYDSNDKISGILCSGEDITDLLSMEVKLRSGERRLNTIINSATDGIIVTDSNEIVLFVNPAAEKILGKKSKEIIGYPFGFKMKANEISEIEIISRAGSDSIIAEMSVVDIDWSNCPAFLATLRDITEHKKAQENIIKLSQFQQSIIDNANVWLYVVDKNSNIVVWNKAAENLSGYSQAEVVGSNNVWKWLYPDLKYRNEVTSFIASSINRNRPIENYETTIVTKTGESMTITWYIHNIFDEKGEIISSLSLGRDITVMKHTEAKLQASFEKTNRALDGAIKAVIMTLETRDPYTAGHQKKVADIAKSIAKEMNLAEEKIEAIYIAGAMHDIGKISVPVEILSKPGKLTEPEFSIIKEHPKIGYEILKPIEFPWPIADIVLQHHESCNGSGYPRGLKKDEICIEARILAVADTIEAISSDRPYRPAMGLQKAISAISENKDDTFDAEVIKATLRLFYEKGYTFTF